MKGSAGEKKQSLPRGWSVGKVEGKRLDGSAGNRRQICREDGVSRTLRGSGWEKEQRRGIRKQGGGQEVTEGWAGSRSKSCHQDGASRKTRSKTWDGVRTWIFLGDGRRKKG